MSIKNDNKNKMLSMRDIAIWKNKEETIKKEFDQKRRDINRKIYHLKFLETVVLTIVLLVVILIVIGVK